MMRESLTTAAIALGYFVLWVAASSGLIGGAVYLTGLYPDYRGAVVLKICHGTTIYRLRDGRIVAGGHRVDNPETVCEVP